MYPIDQSSISGGPDEALDDGFNVALLSWPVLARRAPLSVGLLPVGAACKAHGPHLPLATDAIQAAWIAARAAQRREALVWPVVGYGHYPAFTAYPGSPSLDADVFTQTLVRVLRSMTASGHRRCVVLNTGISTIECVDAACGAVADTVPCHVYAGERFMRAAAEVSEQAGGGHADELETSLMLHLAPAMVDMARAADASGTSFGPGPLNPDDPHAPNYAPSGVMGNARLANARKGRRLAEAMLEDVLAVIDRDAAP